jgi:hypothetical protein
MPAIGIAATTIVASCAWCWARVSGSLSSGSRPASDRLRPRSAIAAVRGVAGRSVHLRGSRLRTGAGWHCGQLPAREPCRTTRAGRRASAGLILGK